MQRKARVRDDRVRVEGSCGVQDKSSTHLGLCEGSWKL